MKIEEIEKEISGLYKEILLREADKIGLEYWSKKMLNELLNLEDIKNELLKSDEYKQLKISIEFPKFNTKISTHEIQEIIDKTSWYHSFNFNGIQNKNTRTTPYEQLWISQFLPKSFKGKSVLDMGCADGFFGFLAAKNEAEKVVCGDFMKFKGFEAAEKITDLHVEHRIINLFDFKETRKFDYVFCFGLYYHLPDPVQSIRYLASITNDTLYFAGPIADDSEPLMYYYEPFELYSADDSNWWVASPSCITGIAKRVGFRDAELIGDRPATHWAIPLQNKKSKRVIQKYGIFKFLK